MKFGLFYAVELINSLAVSGIMASLFFGGYSLFGLDEWIPPWIIFIGKIYFFYFGLIWLRGTLPRLRIDQLMAFAWKMLIPLALINIAVVAVEVLLWRELRADDWVLARVRADQPRPGDRHADAASSGSITARTTTACRAACAWCTTFRCPRCRRRRRRPVDPAMSRRVQGGRSGS